MSYPIAKPEMISFPDNIRRWNSCKQLSLTIPYYNSMFMCYLTILSIPNVNFTICKIEGQHRCSTELICTNLKGILNDIIGKLEGQDCRNIIDYAQYKLDWLIGLLLRIGGSLEESILPYLLQANQLLLTNDMNNSPTFLTTGLKLLILQACCVFPAKPFKEDWKISECRYVEHMLN